jgi:transcriptional regulator with PAS, ATPase and Fis domain
MTLGASGVFEIGSVIVVARAHSEGDAKAAAPPSVMEEVEKLADVVARSAISVVLLGETGVGKTVVAQRIHRASKRAAAPFVSVNCAALPEQLLESELFGHERGAFTGATATKIGLLEAADGGTLFLDEIGEMPLATQSKILRVLESGDVTRLGATKPRHVDVRYVCATNRDLKTAVERGHFRSDLFFRLDGISITIPPLRERVAEIGRLADAFLAEAARDLGKEPPRLSPEALARLERHPWPGNVRELKNVMMRTALLAAFPTLRADDVRFEGQAGPAPSSTEAPSRAKDRERQQILDALEQTAWNQTRAAEVLGISRRTLLNRLDEFQIKRPRK